MNTNITLAREIYGQPWYMDAISLQQFTGVLNDFRAGAISATTEKHNGFGMFDLKAETVINTTPYTDFSKLQANENYISVIDLDGPITKYGGQSHYGTQDLAAAMLKAEKQPNIIGHIIRTNSGGGSAKAVEEFTDVFSQIEKPVVAWVDDMAASAAYYIISFADWIVSHRNSDVVGSIGTMIQYSGYPTVAEDKTDGYRNVRIYADASFNKNKEFEEAINNLNFRPVIENVLNPFNAKFMVDVRGNRPLIGENEITGATFLAGQSIGALVDEIGNFEIAVNKVIELHELKNNNPLITENQMTKDELKQKHADVYNEIYNGGVSAERDRIEALMTYADVDLASVRTMVTSGENPTQKFFAEMSRKAMAKDVVTTMQSENIAPISVSVETPAVIESAVESFEKTVFAQLGLTK